MATPHRACQRRRAAGCGGFREGRLDRHHLSPLGLTANERDRNVPHGRIGFGAMPMALASLDVRHITDVDLALLMLRRHDAGSRSHDQDLVAIVGMPSRVAALAEVHRVVLVHDRLDDCLASPGYRARPACGLLGRTFGRDVWDVLKRDDLHDARLHWFEVDE